MASSMVHASAGLAGEWSSRSDCVAPAIGRQAVWLSQGSRLDVTNDGVQHARPCLWCAPPAREHTGQDGPTKRALAAVAELVSEHTVHGSERIARSLRASERREARGMTH